MNFNEKLKKYREVNNLTQAQLAKRTGFSRTTITELENGTKKATLRAIEKIAKGTNTSTSDWIDSTNDMKIKQFDGLTLVIDALCETGEIDNDGNISDQGMVMLTKMLEKEVKLYVDRRRN
ncbi:helix-turn-helix transcriptional regulator [Clostridium sp.]|uniref:helix-turn-helix domain-containing protein n=1 Tax=Clostridium sp. TaxID=1506 RepID=UPI0032174117